VPIADPVGVGVKVAVAEPVGVNVAVLVGRPCDGGHRCLRGRPGCRGCSRLRRGRCASSRLRWVRVGVDVTVFDAERVGVASGCLRCGGGRRASAVFVAVGVRVAVLCGGCSRCASGCLGCGSRLGWVRVRVGVSRLRGGGGESRRDCRGPRDGISFTGVEFPLPAPIPPIRMARQILDSCHLSTTSRRKVPDPLAGLAVTL